MATPKTHGGWYRGKRVVALDGSVLDIPDSAENATTFGRPGSTRGERSGFPQVRLVSLVECGTHAHFNYATGPLKQGETTLTRKLLPSLTAEMWCLADRNFFGITLWQEAADTGCSSFQEHRRPAIWLGDPCPMLLEGLGRMPHPGRRRGPRPPRANGRLCDHGGPDWGDGPILSGR